MDTTQKDGKSGSELDVSAVCTFAQNMKATVHSVFCGKDEAVHFAVLGMASSLHVLIEDVPGVGKTTLARSIAEAAGLSFSRIQFTPDMLPSDVLGMNVWNPTKNEFFFRSGAINAQCILADELNRTSPRTQSAFLEAMQENQVTIDGVTRALPEPFFLIATQNPQTFTGTFPLPEAELDRFGLSFSIGYPSENEELSILTRHSGKTAALPDASMQTVDASSLEGAAFADASAKNDASVNGDGTTQQNAASVTEDASPASAPKTANTASPKTARVTDANGIRAVRAIVNAVHVSECVQKYIVDIVRATRNNEHITLGASPRAAVYVQQASRAQAACNGRNFVLPEDVLFVCPVVLSHRIVLSSSARLDHLDAKAVIKAVCKHVPLPTGL